LKAASRIYFQANR